MVIAKKGKRARRKGKDLPAKDLSVKHAEKVKAGAEPAPRYFGGISNRIVSGVSR